ncbi:MAG: hypothetical protein V4717_20070 [Bacteroidota bacterium]
MQNVAEPHKMTEPGIDRQIANTEKNIPGWGIDANPENDPSYPMKQRNGADYERLNYEKPVQQTVDIEILHSNERPGVTRVFGTASPPSGLSGMMRRYAFKYSESSYAHWASLVLADRINVIEAYLDDLANGIVPNPFLERGWKAEWKYNRKAMIRNVLVRTAIISAIVATIVYRNKNKSASRRVKSLIAK